MTPARLPDPLLMSLLHEDAPHGDLTSESLPALASAQGVATFTARQPQILSGIEEAARLFQLAGGASIDVRIHVPSGMPVAAGTPLLDARGPARALLRAWKTAQTLVEAMGGIATGTHAIVQALAAAGCPRPVACTRKNLPGSRAIAARAVRDGGGVMHRLGLSETLLLFPEHRAFLSPEAQVEAVRMLRATQPEKRLVVEVGDAAAALDLARQGADVLQLERFKPEAVAALAAALAAEGLRPLLASAGGVTVHNAVAHARAGAHLLVTSAPYLAPPTDVQVRIGPG